MLESCFLLLWHCGGLSLQHKAFVVWMMLVRVGLFLMVSGKKNRAFILFKLWNVIFVITLVILEADKFLKCDWLRPVIFKPNLKYLHAKITLVT